MTQYLTKAEKLVLVGKKVLLTLGEAYVKSRNRCHVDWVSMTFKKSDLLNSEFFLAQDSSAFGSGELEIDIIRMLTRKMAHMSGFEIGTMRKGRNYYKHTETLVNDQGEEVGSVSGGGHEQKDTFSLIVRGSGCTFADHHWLQHLYDFCMPLHGKLTRIDLALDFFEGGSGGVEGVRAAFLAGQFDYNGRRPISTTAAPSIVHLTKAFDEGQHGFMWLCDLCIKHAYRELPRSLRGIPSIDLKTAIQKMLSPTPSAPAGLVTT
jgi:phage replication initiation protein